MINQSRCFAIWRVFAMVALVFTLGQIRLAHANGAPEYTVGVVPQFDQRKLFGIWSPILDELSKKTGFKFKLVVTQSVSEFETQLSRGGFDFVYANPYHIFRERSRQGYMPLLRDQEPLRGIIVVAKDGPIQTIEQLNGQVLAVPSMNALGASLMVRADLARKFKVSVVPFNVKTHSSVYLHVANGLAPAGGGVEKTLAEQDARVRDLLRVIYVTREIPSHPIAVHPRVPERVAKAFQSAFLELAKRDSTLQFIRQIPMTAPVATSMQEYHPMKDWGIEALWTD